MSIDYRYTIKRKVDDKVIGSFYYNMIKNLGNVSCADFDLKLDPSDAYYDRVSIKYTVDDISNDINALRKHIEVISIKMSEKKLLIAMAANRDIKDELENDIFILESEIKDCEYAIEALAGLQAVVNVLVEDNVNIADDTKDKIAYIYNAKDLPKTKDGYDSHLFVSDVYLEVQKL